MDSSLDLRETIQTVIHGILEETGRPKPGMADGNQLFAEIGLDSLDFARVVVELEQKLGVDPFRSPGQDVRTFGDLVRVYRETLEKMA